MNPGAGVTPTPTTHHPRRAAAFFAYGIDGHRHLPEIVESGTTALIVEQDAILDAARFADTIADGRVNVLQVVPSYLEVVLSYLDQNPRELPDLRYVSVTGEALKRELAQRWFAAKPGIRLVNAYGLTETSDDTNHEVMDRAPAGERIPLGRPVSNVRVYVVDEDLRPVPLGAAGLIAFTGVCVGRGYINDPERTRQCYLTDPHRDGQRLYLGGDYGRWRPDGKLEFLGRRDSQVKISGFRIEIGEIENTLLRVPGVRDGAVVVAAGPGQGQRLVAFYSGPGPIEAGTLRDRLGASLPWYMVPAVFHWRENLPLTANSKIDSKALIALAVASPVIGFVALAYHVGLVVIAARDLALLPAGLKAPSTRSIARVTAFARARRRPGGFPALGYPRPRSARARDSALPCR